MAIPEQNRRALHPAVSISSWLIFVLAVELASPHQLGWLGLLAMYLVAGRSVMQRFVRLVWKARWLWLALIIIYAWTVPGTLLWPTDWSPSREGLQTGFTRVARLLLLLAALARLQSEFSPQQLAGGVYLLAKPLGRLGLDRRALAVRLALTLEYLEQPARGRNWMDELRAPLIQASGPDEIRLSFARSGLLDALILSMSVALLGAVLMRIGA